MNISHHPDDSTLMSYVAGSLAEPLSAVVCAHLAMCPYCVGEVRRMERIGAALMDTLEPASLSRPVPQLALRAMEADVAARHQEPAAEGDIPVPLRRMLGARIDDIHWKRLGPGVWHVPLTTQRGGGDLRLLRVGLGRAMPEHGHGGTELTLILRGSYRDEFGIYYPGDVADLDSDAEHRPVADEKLGCICIIASERRAHFKSLVARIFQPLTGF